MILFLLGLVVGTLVGSVGVCLTLYWLGRLAQKAAAASAVAQFTDRMNASRQALRDAPAAHFDGRMH